MGCTTGSLVHNVRADLDHAVVTISDPTPPAAPTASGPLTQAGWVSGAASLEMASSDAVGISKLQAVGPDGVARATAHQTCDYTFPTPCPVQAGARLQIDTTSLKDGVSTLSLVATDAAQNTSTTTIHPMIANHPPAPPTLTGVAAGPTSQRSATITAHVAPAGVPIPTVDWMLCTTTCGPPAAVPVHDATATFTAAPPADGSYTIKAYAVDAAGHVSATASAPLVVKQAAQAPQAGGPNAGVTLPGAVGHGGVRLVLSLRRRPHGRVELAVRAGPTRSGTVHVGLTFAGHRPTSHTLHLRHGLAKLVARVPPRARTLTISLTGLGAQSTRVIRLGPHA